jgi:two-component system OmpR family sensor kinase
VTVTGDARRLARARRLIALQAVGGVLAGVAVASLATFGVVLVGQHREQQTQLRSLADAAPMRGLPAGTWVVLLGADGTRHASATAPEGRPSAAEVAAARQHALPVVTESYVEDREYQTLTRSRGSSVVQVGVDVAPYENERHRLLWALLLAGLGAAVIAFGLGRWLGHRAVAAWDEALVRQRRFVADASHELRTPLSRLALRADLLQRELARVDPPIPAGAAGDLTLLRHEARGLGDIVQDLLHAADLAASCGRWCSATRSWRPNVASPFGAPRWTSRPCGVLRPRCGGSSTPWSTTHCATRALPWRSASSRTERVSAWRSTTTVPA